MRTGKMALSGALALVLGALAGRAFATQSMSGAPPAPAASAAVQVDVSACQTCHGPNGISRNQHVPNLAGQQAAYLVLQLQAFRNGTRHNPVMESIAVASWNACNGPAQACCGRLREGWEAAVF